MNEIIAAFSGAKHAADLMAMAVSTRDHRKIAAATDDLMRELIELREKLFMAQSRFQELQIRLHESELCRHQLEAQINKQTEYRVHQITPGAFCYRHEPAENSGEPVYYVCQPCHAQAKESILRIHYSPAGEPVLIACPLNAQHNIRMPGTPLEQP